MEFSFQPPAVQGRCQAFLDATSLHRVYHHPRKQASIPFAVGAPPCCLPPRNSTGRASLPSKIHSGPTLPGRLRVSSLRSNDQPLFPLGHPPLLRGGTTTEAIELEPPKEGTKTDTQTHLSCRIKGGKDVRVSGAKWRTFRGNGFLFRNF